MTQYPCRTLGEICDVLDSKRKPITKIHRTSGQFPYYGATGVLDYVDDYIFDEPLILIGEDGAKWGAGENSAFSVTGRCWVNNHAHVIRPHRNVALDKWIIYYLNASDLSPFITGLTVPKLNQAKLRDIPIPLPPLRAQERLVAVIDEVFESVSTAVANTEKNLASARELLDAFLTSIFTNRGSVWTETKLGEIAAFKNGLNFTKSSKGETIKIVGVKDFQKNFYVPHDRLETTQIDGTLSAEYRLQSNDIVIVRSNGNKQLIGRCLLANDIHEKTSHSGFTIRLRLTSESVSAAYLVYFLKSKASREALIEGGEGINISSLNQRTLSALPVQFPALSEQSVIAAKLEAIAAKTKALEDNYRQKLGALTELKQAILNQAFSGQLMARFAKTMQEAAE